jgi:uncharacterized membrane protein
VRSSLGRKGGCNPIPLASEPKSGAPGDSIAITAEAFRAALPLVHHR